MINWYGKIRSSIKFCGPIFLCLLGAAAVTPQGTDSSLPPGVLTLKHKWNVEGRYLPRWEDDSSRLNRLRMIQVYSVKIKNTGAKKIAGVVWDYVFLREEKELARIRFGTKKEVAAGKSETLEGTTRRPPHFPRVVSVEDMQKPSDLKYRDQVEIKCVLYDDGTWWRHPNITADGCVKLQGAQRISGW